MSKNTTFNSVEDIVKYVMNYPQSTQRFSCEESTDWVWDNEADGKVWEDMRNSTDRPWLYNHGTPEREAAEKAQEDLEKIKPSMHQEYTVTLRETGDGWHHDYIKCGVELSARIAKVWTRGPAYRGATRDVPKGALTLAGLLKRLGRTDISKQIDNAKAAIEAQNAKNHRNYARREIAAKAMELLKLISKDGALISVNENMTLMELAKLVDQQEA